MRSDNLTAILACNILATKQSSLSTIGALTRSSWLWAIFSLGFWSANAKGGEGGKVAVRSRGGAAAKQS